jgi:hypothetical protein
MDDDLRRFKAGIFQALGNPRRIAIVEQANVSQHLAVLRAKQVVVGRKKGTQVYYSLRDPVLGKILNLMRRYFRTHIHEILELYQTMDEKG